MIFTRHIQIKSIVLETNNSMHERSNGHIDKYVTCTLGFNSNELVHITLRILNIVFIIQGIQLLVTNLSRNSYLNKSVLHVGEASAVAGILSKFQRKIGMKASVIHFDSDAFGYVSFYNSKIIKPHNFLRVKPVATITSTDNTKPPWDSINIHKQDTDVSIPYWDSSIVKMLRRIAQKIRLGNLNKLLDHVKAYDIIHMHNHYQFAPFIRQKFPHKQITLHRHGTDLRNANSAMRNIQEKQEGYADLVLVATEDLLSHLSNTIGFYLPIPCDTELFRAPKQPDVKQEKILRIKNIFVSDIWADNQYHKLNIGLPYTVLERNIKYPDMPHILQEYTHYIDWSPIRSDGQHNSFTSTGLQALACGLTVLGGDMKMHFGGLPSRHKPENVVKQLNKFYEQSQTK